MSEKIYSLIDEIEVNELVLPEFQREYIWNLSQSSELLRSLFKDFPTGSLLFWKTLNPPELKNKEVSKDAGFVKVILDGQQRLTTLYLLIKNKIPPYYKKDEIKEDPRHLYFNLRTGDFMYYKISEMIGKSNWVSVVDCFNKEINCGDIANEIKESDEDLAKLIQTLYQNLEKLRSIQKTEYPIQYLPHKANLGEAVEVFDKVNSLGTKLTEAELALAHICSNWSIARREFKKKLEEIRQYGYKFDLDFIVRCLTGILTGRARYELIHNIPEDKLFDGWNKLSKILDYVINQLKHRMYISSSEDINTSNVLIPFVVYTHMKNFHFTEEELRKIQRWIYLSLIWSRYTSQATQKLDRDLSHLKEDKPIEKLVNEIISERGRIVLTEEDLKKKGTYHPLFPMLKILVKRNNSLDWSNGIPISETLGKSFKVVSHHIFPKSKLYKNNFNSKIYSNRYVVNEIANRVFLTSHANMDFFIDPPEKYLPMVEQIFPGEINKQYIPINKELWKIENFNAFLIERRKLIADAINNFLNELLLKDKEFENILDIIKKDEGQYLEFKSTLRYDIDRNIINSDLEKSCIKTICAYLNAEGGNLIIGISDKKQILGLNYDYETLKKKNRDGFENHLINILSSKIGNNFLTFLNVSFYEIENKDICKIRVYHSNEPAFLKEGITQEFYVRIGNSSRPYSMSEAAKYIKEIWK